MYRMQDYIDAQFGGPGTGLLPDRALAVRGPAGRSTPGRWPWSWASRPACPSAARSPPPPDPTVPAAATTRRPSAPRRHRPPARRGARARRAPDGAGQQVRQRAVRDRRRRGPDRRGGERRQLPRDRHASGTCGTASRRTRPPTTATSSPRPRSRPSSRTRCSAPSAQLFGAANLPALPVYPPPDHCNSRGLTTLGEHTIAGLAEAAHALRPRPHERRGAHARRSTRSSPMGYSRRAVEPLLVDRGRLPAHLPAGRVRRAVRRRLDRLRARSGAGTSAGRTRATTSGIGYGADINGLGAQGDPRGADVAQPGHLPLPRPRTASGSRASTPASGSTTSTPTASRSTASTRTGSRT